MDKVLSQFQALVEVVQQLRSPTGCPWDLEQTQQSLTQYAIEEAFELVEAIEAGDQSQIKDELGDYLFQVLLQAQVAKDEGYFELEEVLKHQADKLIRRHPHVFGAEELKNTADVWRNWHKQKLAEKKEVFSYPKNLPALQASHKIGVKSKAFQFDWNHVSEVLEKVKEELAETEEALESGDSNSVKHEIGDLLFSVAQLARHAGLEAEACLREANRRFEKRFLLALELSKKSKEEFAQLPPEEKESYWELAKRRLADVT